MWVQGVCRQMSKKNVIRSLLKHAQYFKSSGCSGAAPNFYVWAPSSPKSISWRLNCLTVKLLPAAGVYCRKPQQAAASASFRTIDFMFVLLSCFLCAAAANLLVFKRMFLCCLFVCPFSVRSTAERLKVNRRNCSFNIFLHQRDSTTISCPSLVLCVRFDVV